MKRKPDLPSGEPEFIKRARAAGKLKVFKSLEEVAAAREARAKRGVVEAPVHLLPDDHFRRRKRKNVTLDPTAIAIAKKLAGGNISRGIERALYHFQDCPRTDGRRKPGSKA